MNNNEFFDYLNELILKGYIYFEEAEKKEMLDRHEELNNGVMKMVEDIRGVIKSGEKI